MKFMSADVRMQFREKMRNKQIAAAVRVSGLAVLIGASHG
jgi:hypothetical protein